MPNTSTKYNIKSDLPSRGLLVLFCLSFIVISAFWFKKEILELWMRFSIRNEYIVVSMTTTPHRISSMRPVVDFVLSEKIPLQTIYANIPYIFKRDNIEYVIPAWLQNNPHVTILRSDDYGPATKLLGALEQAKLPPNAIIITVDDDVNYPSGMLLYLAYHAQQNPDHAVGYSGMYPFYNKNGKIITDSPTGVGLKAIKTHKASAAILEGFAGIAYRAGFFDESIFAIKDAPRECRNSDDIYISFYLAKQNVPRQVLRSPYMNLERIAWNDAIALNSDALHRLTPSPSMRHRLCVEFLKEHDPQVIF